MSTEVVGTPRLAGGPQASAPARVGAHTARPGCPALNFADQQDPEQESDYWRARDLIAATKGKSTPLLLTQGFLEDNTKPDGTWDLYNGLAGPRVTVDAAVTLPGANLVVDLEDYRANAPFAVDAATVDQATSAALAVPAVGTCA
jgi:hypothetical protein